MTWTTTTVSEERTELEPLLVQEVNPGLTRGQWLILALQALTLLVLVAVGFAPTATPPPPPTPWVWAIPTDVVRGCVVDANGNVGPCFEDTTP